MSELPGSSSHEVLIEKYLLGTLSPAEANQLLHALQAQPALGGDLLDYLQMHEMLRHLIQAGTLASPLAQDDPASRIEPAASVPASKGFAWTHPLMWVSGLAACIAALIGASLLWRSAPAGSRKESTTYAVAVMTRMVDAEWAHSGEVHYVGGALAPGWLHLKGGVVQVDFFNGARVVLQGPAAFQVVSAQEAFCDFGRLSAEVPPSAHGFRIRTPHMVLVDLGTAFGLAVNETNAELHVFKGEVELQERSAAKQNLKEGQGASVADTGTWRQFAASPSAFMSAADLDRSVLADQHLRLQSWRAASAQLSHDPSLILHFDFEDVTALERTLHNRAAGPAAAGDATLVGCSSEQGRWPGKHSLEFTGVGSRALVNVPGEFRSLTFAAWVRVNSLENNYNSLFMCDAFNPGAPHWQILASGAVRLGVANTDPAAHAEYDAPVIFTPERLGQWIHLAVVYDAAAKQVTHFVNGQLVSRQPVLFETALRLGPTQLGNWNRGAYTADATPIRNFSGRMDEFQFFRRPLSDTEVRQLCNVGRPESVRIAKATN